MIALFWIGLIISAVCGIWLLVVTFKISILWGLLSLFIPICSLIFVIMHWQETKKPFLYNLAGVALMVIAVVMHPGIWQRV